MDLRQLEMLLAVAENGSFIQAGQKLYVAQSAISRKISMLEDELGEKLFARVNKKIYITPAGETMIRHARIIFQDLRNATMEVSEISRLERGQLRVGAGPSVCMYLLTPVLHQFRLLYPKIKLEVITGAADSLLSRARKSEIDLGVFILPVRSPDLTIVPLCTEELVVIASRKHAVLSTRTSINTSELADYPIVLLSEGTRAPNTVDQFFSEKKITPRVAMMAEDISAILPLVKMDSWISIVPFRAVEEEFKRHELHCVRIHGRKITREVGLAFPKSEQVPKILSELIRLFNQNQKRPELMVAFPPARAFG